MSVKEFTEELASNSPAPGGGSVAALSGALAAGLVAMVCRLTIGKKKYESVEELMEKTLAQVETFQRSLTCLVDDDTEAFNQVMAAFKLPRETPDQKSQRSCAIQVAFKNAADIPFRVSQHCFEVLMLINDIAGKANANALSDIGVAAEASVTGLRGALMNVRINLGSITDAEYTAQKQQQANQFYQDALQIKNRIDQIIEQGL